jgi:hypothetical protein
VVGVCEGGGAEGVGAHACILDARKGRSHHQGGPADVSTATLDAVASEGCTGSTVLSRDPAPHVDTRNAIKASCRRQDDSESTLPVTNLGAGGGGGARAPRESVGKQVLPNGARIESTRSKCAAARAGVSHAITGVPHEGQSASANSTPKTAKPGELSFQLEKDKKFRVYLGDRSVASIEIDAT